MFLRLMSVVTSCCLVLPEDRTRVAKTAGMDIIFLDVDRKSKHVRTTELQPLYSDILARQVEASVKKIIETDHGGVLTKSSLFHATVRAVNELERLLPTALISQGFITLDYRPISAPMRRNEFGAELWSKTEIVSTKY